MVPIMADTSDISRALGDMIRMGTVEAVDVADATCTARIGEIVTGPLPWLAFRAGGTRYWSPPSAGEQCLILSPEGDTEASVVIVGIYSTARPAPDDSADRDLIAFADGARLSYDAAAHALVAELPAGATVLITAPGGLTFDGDLTINGEVAVNGGVTVSEDVVASGISLATHRHGGVQAGAAETGEPT